MKAHGGNFLAEIATYENGGDHADKLSCRREEKRFSAFLLERKNAGKKRYTVHYTLFHWPSNCPLFPRNAGS